MEVSDITIIGAGVVGLSVAASLAKPGKNVFLLEKHYSFGQETSSRNSEVIHASIYYPRNSLKGRLCLEGNELMYDICRKNNIPHKNTGKLIVAVTDEEEAKLEGLLETAINNGARGVRIIDKKEIERIEPNVQAKAAILCPTSGIVDSHSLMKFFEAKALSNDANIVYGVEVISVEKNSDGYTLGVRDRENNLFEFKTQILINCAGHGSDKIAEFAGIDIDQYGYRLNFSKGMYFRVTRELDKFPEMLIYPVPPRPGWVGIHTTPDLGGGMRLGPYDVWQNEIEYSVDESLREFFYDNTKSFLPFLNIDDMQPDMAGVHPKLQRPGEPIHDFVISHEEDKGFPGLINLIGIESPGLTSSPAIGRYVAGMVESLNS